MKTRYTFLSLLSIAFLYGCRGKSQYELVVDGKSLLWEVSGNGLKQPSFFLGTMHLMCAEDAILSKNAEQIIKEVAQVYLEVDMDNINELAGGLNLGMRDGLTLKDVMEAGDYEKVKSFFETFQRGMPFSVLERQHPLMLSSGLYELFLDCDKKNGIDLRVIDAAYKAKKETKGLETFAFQAGIFDSIPYEKQAADLLKTIDSLDKYKSSVQQMVEVYKTQDVEKLYTLTSEEENGAANYLDILLHKRNANWVQQFPAIALQQPTLFAVGAGHLGGDKGVLNLLKKKGYTLKAIYNK